MIKAAFTQSKLFKFVKPFLWLQALSMFFLIASNGLGLYVPQLNAQIIDTFVETGKIETSFVFQVVGIIIFIFIAASLRITVNGIIGESLAYNIRNTLFEKVLKFSSKTVSKKGTGKLLTIITNDVKGIRDIFNWGLDSMIGAMMFLVGSVIFMTIINAGLMLRVLLIVPIVIVGFYITFTQATKLFGKSQEVTDNMNRILDETIKGSRLIRVFVGELREVKKFLEQNIAARKVGTDILTLFALLIPIITLAGNVGTLIIIWFGGQQVINNELTFGEFTAFNSYVSLFIFPFIIIGFISSGVGRATATFSRITDLVDVKDTFVNGKSELTEINEVEFKKVSLAAKKGKSVLLNKVDLEIKKGQKVGLVGATGSGKSLILQMTLRLTEPTAGDIKINGKKIESYDILTVRDKIAFVFQENILFNGTIRENILFGRENVSEEVFKTAVEIAQVDEFVQKFPGKYDEVVGERGATLSGGQKQRISIARALVASPQVLLLDDSTSSLDIQTERKIFAGLKEAFPELTIVVVSQKVVSVKDADKIYVLDNGNIESVGTHEELKKKSIIYQEIINSQRSISS